MNTLITALFALLFAQHAFTPEKISEGGQLFQSNCAGCHGSAGDQVPGVALMSGKFRRASADEDVARIIRNGIAGTTMQGFNFTDQQSGMVVAYLRSFAGNSASGDMPALGDAARGKQVFEGKGQCLSCHRVGENGSRVGPDLTSIGAPRRALVFFGPPAPAPTPAAIFQQLQRSLLDPDAEVAPANRTYRAVLKDGSAITGRLLNLDTFTIQLFDSKERLMTIPKSELREFTLQKSPMPSYRDKLTDQELSDLLAYLFSLKGQVKQ
ncbi:MAG TPA: c-type cytochrome [Terriglobia bacterium]|nr:c-type cytochrome [Terriglobia bacterium]